MGVEAMIPEPVTIIDVPVLEANVALVDNSKPAGEVTVIPEEML